MNTLAAMTEGGHELVCFHHDAASGVRAIIAVHSTALGPGFGGVRRWHYPSETAALEDVLRLSEGMTYKAAAADIPIGGGKAVVLLPRPDTAATRTEALALGRFVETIGGTYVSAEDVGLSPEYIDWMSEATDYVTGGDATGGDPSPHTAQGVINAMLAALAYCGRPRDLAGVRVAIQGAGNVGGHLARLLRDLGATVLVADLDMATVSRVVEETGAIAVAPDEVLTAECDILAPCALGGVINGTLIPSLRCPMICGGANNILEDYDEDGVALKAREIVYVPDFIANAGGMIELAGMYRGLSPAERQQRIVDIERTALEVLRSAENHASTYASAVAFARDRISRRSEEHAHAR